MPAVGTAAADAIVELERPGPRPVDKFKDRALCKGCSRERYLFRNSYGGRARSGPTHGPAAPSMAVLHANCMRIHLFVAQMQQGRPSLGSAPPAAPTTKVPLPHFGGCAYRWRAATSRCPTRPQTPHPPLPRRRSLLSRPPVYLPHRRRTFLHLPQSPYHRLCHLPRACPRPLLPCPACHRHRWPRPPRRR